MTGYKSRKATKQVFGRRKKSITRVGQLLIRIRTYHYKVEKVSLTSRLNTFPSSFYVHQSILDSLYRFFSLVSIFSHHFTAVLEYLRSFTYIFYGKYNICFLDYDAEYLKVFWLLYRQSRTECKIWFNLRKVQVTAPIFAYKDRNIL